MQNVLVVFSSPTEGAEDAYNDWYTNDHLAEVVEIPGFVAARRYRLTDAQVPGFPQSSHAYMSIYEIEGDPGEALERLMAELESGRMALPDSIQQTTIAPWSFEAISGRVTA
jgi:hypothetical protein